MMEDLKLSTMGSDNKAYTNHGYNVEDEIYSGNEVPLKNAKNGEDDIEKRDFFSETLATGWSTPFKYYSTILKY